MKIGKLYEITQWWGIHHSIQDFWKDCGPVLYLGEDMVEVEGSRPDNFAVFVKGQRRFLDKTFLKHLQPLVIPGVTK